MREGFTHSNPRSLLGLHGPPDAERPFRAYGGPGAHHDYLLPQMPSCWPATASASSTTSVAAGAPGTMTTATITWESQCVTARAVIHERSLER